MNSIQAPTHCPSCDSELVWVNSILYCKSLDCDATRSKKLEHYAKTLKIKGLGPATIRKLNITTITELYKLSEEDIIALLDSKALGVKLFRELENSKKASANMLLPAFGIPLVGKTATDKIAAVAATIYDINEALCLEAGLGPKVTENLVSWVNSNQDLLDSLPFYCSFEEIKKPARNLGIVCISGKLKSFKTKSEAKLALEAGGYTVVDSLTKQVTILVNESGVESSKTKKARDSGVTIVTSLISLIGE